MFDHFADDTPIGALHQVNNAHRYWVQHQLSQMGLYFGQQLVLLGLLHHGKEDISQRELADMIGVSAASMATSIKRMEKSGLIARSADERDTRRNQITLTDRGKQYAKRCQKIFDRADNQMFSGFSEKEKQQVTEYLIRMRNNMGWRDWSPKERKAMMDKLMPHKHEHHHHDHE